MSPGRVAREVVDLMAAGTRQKGLDLRLEVAAGTPDLVHADPLRLRQVLTNLVSNATKFTETGSITVRVDYDTRAGALVLEVEDTGIGIPPAATGRLFEDFFQVEMDDDRRRGGSGLGLAICKGLVELMGGRIGLRSVLGAGSVFSVVVPADVAAGPLPATQPPEPQTPAADPALRILVAEDNATSQFLLRSYLEAAGHDVTTVEDGYEAVQAARTGAFDVILMDVQMPRMDGPTAARAIRALDGPGGRAPIIALTANDLPDDRDSYAAAGMTDFISKPIDFALLRAALCRAGSAAMVAG